MAYVEVQAVVLSTPMEKWLKGDEGKIIFLLVITERELQHGGKSRNGIMLSPSLKLQN